MYPDEFLKGLHNKTLFDPFGPLVEDIIHRYILINKNSKDVDYPKGLEFFQEWRTHKLYDPLDVDLNQYCPEKDNRNNNFIKNQNNFNNSMKRSHYSISKKIDENMESKQFQNNNSNKSEIRGKNEIKLSDFFDEDETGNPYKYETYPPDNFDISLDMFSGLYFRILTYNHPTIDGGFVFLKSKEKIAKFENLKNNFNSLNSDFDKINLNLLLITYDATINQEKVEYLMKKKEYVVNNLKQIYKKFYDKSDIPLSGGIIKHYFIVFENKGEIFELIYFQYFFNLEIYEVDDTLRKKINDDSGEKIIEISKSDRLYEEIRNDEMFGIIVARIVKIDYPDHKGYSLQFKNYSPKDLGIK